MRALPSSPQTIDVEVFQKGAWRSFFRSDVLACLTRQTGGVRSCHVYYDKDVVSIMSEKQVFGRNLFKLELKNLIYMQF